MKYLKAILITLLVISLLGCGNQEDNSDIKEISEIIDSVEFEVIHEDSDGDNDEDKISIWRYDCMNDTIKQIKKVDKDTLSYEKLINIINLKYQNGVNLDYVKISNDTIFVKINNSEYLTQQMGTTGADEYMISTTFTLTELSRIEFVYFDFEYGDHASPGTYSRKYFLDWIKENKKLKKQ